MKLICFEHTLIKYLRIKELPLLLFLSPPSRDPQLFSNLSFSRVFLIISVTASPFCTTSRFVRTLALDLAYPLLGILGMTIPPPPLRKGISNLQVVFLVL